MVALRQLKLADEFEITDNRRMRVAAVIVTYNPDVDVLRQLLDALLPQVDSALLVDNASHNQQQLAALVSGCEFYASETNLGLGAAHNIGITFARDQQADAVLILDQDSLPAEDMVQRLTAAFAALSSQHKLAAVGAHYANDLGSDAFFVRFGALKFQRHYCQADAHPVAADFLISSGSLFSLAAIDEIGAMDEGLFIDHVDTEWFLRARVKGYQSFGVCDARMQHALGEKTHRIKPLNIGRERNVPQHKPFRYYYIFRNSILLYKRSYSSWRWRWNDLQRLAMMLVMYGVFVPPRGQHLRMIWRGIIDGLRGRIGQLDD